MLGRPTDWMDSIISLGVANNNQNNEGLSTALVPADSARATVIRTIVSLDIHSQTVAGAWGTQIVHLGIGIASQESFTAGVLPDADVSTDRPIRGWMWRTSLVVSQNGVGSQVVFPVRADIRGARKIETGEVYLKIHNTSSYGTSFLIECDGLIRMLIKI